MLTTLPSTSLAAPIKLTVLSGWRIERSLPALTVGAVPFEGGEKVTLLEDCGVDGVLLAPAVVATTSKDDTRFDDAVAGALVLPPPQADIETTTAIKIGESNKILLFMSIPRVFERSKCLSRRVECKATSDKHRRCLYKPKVTLR